jgi:hypothetical protein
VKPPQNQFTLGELMGLVALFALSFALLTTSMAPLGVGVLIVVPGFVLERARGGKGIIGGIISGCVLPQVVVMAWAAFDLLLGGLPGSGVLNLLPAFYLLFVVSLVWSVVASCVLYVVDRRFQGPPRSNARATGPLDAGIRFLSDDDRTGQGPVPVATAVPVRPIPDSRRGPRP